MLINITNKPNLYGQVGRRIEYTGDMANPAGIGAIVAINEPTKHSPLSADIILEDGRILTAVYCNTIVHISEAEGCRHRVLALDDEFATEEEIAGLHAKRALKIAADKARKDAADQAFAAEVERLKAEYPDLVAGNDRKAAATNIRKLLKRFKGVKFSVTSPSWGSINVRWTDGPTEKTVDDLLGRFQEGYFDGNNDCYYYSPSPWNKCFGGVHYVHTARECSDELVKRAIDEIVAKYGCEAPSVDDFRAGNLWSKHPAFSQYDWQTVIYQQMRTMEA